MKGDADMTISYAPLWKTMGRKKISKYSLIHHYGVSAGQLHRLKENMHVSTHTLETLCNILHCRIEDVIEIK